MRNPFWTVSGRHVRGASHVRHDLPCQDALLSRKLEDAVILAVADGHGSQRCPYSDEGAQLAVEVATELLEELYTHAEKNGAIIEKLAKEKLPQLIVHRWAERVKAAHVRQGRAEQAETLGDRVLVQYGSTLLAALATEEFVLFVQLGDGDILTVTGEGQVACPMPKDERLIANETTSLCSPKAWQDFTVQYRSLVGLEAPALILLSTDGYSNSFCHREDFLKVGTDFLALIREHGLTAVSEHMGSWLEQTSEEGSGDDITLGILCQSTLAEPMQEVSVTATAEEEATVVVDEPVQEVEEPVVVDEPVQEVEAPVVVEEPAAPKPKRSTRSTRAKTPAAKQEDAGAKPKRTRKKKTETEPVDPK